MPGPTLHCQTARACKRITCTAFALFLVSLQCCAMSNTSSGVGSLQQSRTSPRHQSLDAASAACTFVAATTTN